MADKACPVGVPGYEDSTAGNYPPFKTPEDAGAGASPTLADLQALDSRGVAKGTLPTGPHRKCKRVLPLHPATGCSTGTFQNQLAPTAKDVGWAKFFLWEGGTEWDAFFTAASAQVETPRDAALDHSLSTEQNAQPVQQHDCKPRHMHMLCMLCHCKACSPYKCTATLEHASCTRRCPAAGGPGHPVFATFALSDWDGGWYHHRDCVCNTGHVDCIPHGSAVPGSQKPQGEAAIIMSPSPVTFTCNCQTTIFIDDGC